MSLLRCITSRVVTDDLTEFLALARAYEPVLDYIERCHLALYKGEPMQVLEVLSHLSVIVQDRDPSCPLDNFLDCGGVELVAKLLKVCTVEDIAIQGCVIIVKELGNQKNAAAKELVSDDEMMSAIFSKLRDSRGVEKVVVLLEELLALHLPLNFNLLRAPSFFALLSVAEGRTLAYLCRVLAYLLYDSEDKADLFKAIEPSKKSLGPSTLEINHCVVVSAPRLTHRLVDLIRSPHLSLLRALPTQDVEGIPDGDIWEAGVIEPTPVNAQEFASHQIEVIFVLSVMLTGPRRLQVATQLFEAGFVDAVGRMFDVLSWEITMASAAQALKIQLLRLINNYCEIKSDPRLSASLVTSAERSSVYEGLIQTLLSCHLYNYQDLLEAYECKHGAAPKSTEEFLQSANLVELMNKLVVEENPNCRWKPPKLTVSPNDKGLMSKLINAFRNCTDSTYKLLISSCIEGFLRSSDVFTQLYAVATGLPSDLVSILLSKRHTESNVTQAAFDLFGEILKFNKGSFVCLNHMLTDAQQKRWIEMCCERIVDSNVFLRAVMLSGAYFESVDKRRTDFFLKRFAPKFCASMPIFTAFSEKRLSILSQLLTAVEVKALSQDSKLHIDISCLNTSIMFFILTQNREKLLEELKADSQEAIRNFGELLEFWLKFYLRRGRDAHGIQQSSRVPFSLWRSTVEEIQQLLQCSA